MNTEHTGVKQKNICLSNIWDGKARMMVQDAQYIKWVPCNRSQCEYRE